MPDRILKESICTSETIDELSWFEEVFWYRLTVNCDDYGRFDARPAILKSRLFPLKNSITEKAIAEALNKLSTVGLVTPYVCEGKPYLQLVTWEKYQRIRAKRSKYPEPADICCQLTSNVAVIQSNPIQSESESNAKEPPARRKEYGEFTWVKLTDDEYRGLVTDLGQAELDRCIKYIDESAEGNGNKNKWKNWNLVVRRCSREGWGLKGYQKQAPAPRNNRKDDGEMERLKNYLKTLKEGEG